MSETLTEDEVLFAFHRYVTSPKPDDMNWWVRAFPQYADALREHAVEVIDMSYRAAAHDDELFRLATEG